MSNKEILESYLEGDYCLGGKSPSLSSLDVLTVFGEIRSSLCPLLLYDDSGVRTALIHVSFMNHSIVDHLVTLEVMT